MSFTMEDLPIQPGICASRVRCYTEGAMQRPVKLCNDRPLRIGKETIYKSASFWQLAKSTSRDDEHTSANQRKLCKSCDHLQERGTPLGRTFVSSANIALVVPEATRKMSLQHSFNVHHDERNLSHMESSSSLVASQSTSSIPSSSCKTQDKKNSGESSNRVRDDIPKDTPGTYDEEVELPWEFNKDFPHIPVLERIKEFERQTGVLKTPNPSPGRWKRKSLAILRSPGSVHSSPALSRRNSADEKVIERNSRNSSPAILHLHAEMLGLVFEQDSQGRNNGKVLDTKISRPVPIFPGEILFRSQEVQTDSLPSFSNLTSQLPDLKKMPPDSPTASTSEAPPNLLPQNRDHNSSTATSKKVCESKKIQDGTVLKDLPQRSSSTKTTAGVQAVVANICHSPENHSTLKQDTECVGAPMHLEAEQANNVNVLASSSKLGSSAIPDVFVRTFHEDVIPVPTSDSVLESQCETSPQGLLPEGTSTEKEIPSLDDRAAKSPENLSEIIHVDSSDNCQPTTNIQPQFVESNDESSKAITSEVQDGSSKEATQCNKLDSVEHATASTDHYQSTDSSKDPEPLIDELLNTEASVETDVYSQRCSQQLGECRSEVLETVSGRANPSPGLLAEDSGPCLSDCYSTSSDEESLPTINSGISFSNELRPLGPEAPSLLVPHPKNIKGSDSEPIHLEEAKELLYGQTTEKVSVKERNSIIETHLLNSEHRAQSVSLSSDIEQTESLERLMEVSNSDSLPDACISLGERNIFPRAESNGAAQCSSSDRSAFLKHPSALLDCLPEQNTSLPKAGKLNADQTLYSLGVKPVNLKRKQPALPLPSCIPPSLSSERDFRDPVATPNQVEGSSCSALNTKQVTASLRREHFQPQVQSKQEIELNHLKSKPYRSAKRKKYVNPDKISHLRYLILQSPLVLSDEDDTESDESDVELNEYGEVKQDYPLGRLPDYIVAQIFGNLGTRDLASLKCACKDFKWLIERFDIKGNDSLWSESVLYREDPCMQCGKIRDPRGDVSLCRWHPKIYYRNGEIGRHYWTCCFAAEDDAPGCERSLHDNKWSGSHRRLCKVARSWRQYWRSYPMES